MSMDICLYNNDILNRCTIWNQTWFGDSSWWARVLCEKIGYLQGQGHGEGSSNQYGCFWQIYGTADPFQPNLA